MYGLNVQAVVNADLKFIYFGVIGPGSMNDSRSFNKSGLNLVLEELPVDFYMVGDAAYPLSHKMLVPFVGSQRNIAAQDAFNFYLSQLRIRVEMAFGRLVRKWAILQGKLCCSLVMNSKIITACGRLHNFIIDNQVNNSEPNVRSCASLPNGFEYRPIRVENREDLNRFLDESVIGSSRNRSILVDYIEHEGYKRPSYNVVRNHGSVDIDDDNLLYYTVV